MTSWVYGTVPNKNCENVSYIYLVVYRSYIKQVYGFASVVNIKMMRIQFSP